MSRLIIVGLCALGVAVGPLSPGEAWARQNDGRTAAAPAPTALVYARRYVEAVDMDQTMIQLLEVIMPMAVEAEMARRPGLLPEERQALHESAIEASRRIVPRFVDAIVTAMARVYTEEELLGLVTFYESPIGRSITAKEGELSRVNERLAAELVPEFAEDMIARLCRKIDCTSPTAKPVRTIS